MFISAICRQSAVCKCHTLCKHLRDCSRLFCCLFKKFVFLNVLQSDNNSNTVYVLGHKIFNTFWAFLRAHFNPRLTTRAKMGLSQAQNILIFMPTNINSIIVLVLHFLSLVTPHELRISKYYCSVINHGNHVTHSVLN